MNAERLHAIVMALSQEMPNTLRNLTNLIYVLSPDPDVITWTELTANDNIKLLDFLIRRFNINWVKTAKIEKPDNYTIALYNEQRVLFLRREDTKDEVILETDGVIAGKFESRLENGEIKIYIPKLDSLYERSLVEELSVMYEDLTDTPSDQFSPAWRQMLAEIGGEDFFGSRLKENIEAIFSQNQVSRALVLKNLRKLLNDLQDFKNALDQCSASLKYLKISDEKLEPGECEIGVLIPRGAVENRLINFAEELKELSFIFNTFSEVATGNKDNLTIRTISSSDLLVYLQASAPYAAFVAVCIERIVALYKSILEVKKLQQDLQKKGIPDKIVSDVGDHANNLMKEGIEKFTVEVVDKYYEKDDTERKRELKNAVTISLNKVANRIDRGFNIEVRAASLNDNKEENSEICKLVESIQLATPKMQFLKLDGKSILELPDGKEKPKGKECGVDSSDKPL